MVSLGAKPRLLGCRLCRCNNNYIRLRASTAAASDQAEAACRGRRTEGAGFVVTYVPDVRGVGYIQGLGKTYTWYDSRQTCIIAAAVCALLYLPLLKLIRTGRFQSY